MSHLQQVLREEKEPVNSAKFAPFTLSALSIYSVATNGQKLRKNSGQMNI